MALAHRPGLGRFVMIQGTVLLGVFVVLAVTPAPVTFPDGPWEAALLLKGAVALLLANAFVLQLKAASPRPRASAAALYQAPQSVDVLTESVDYEVCADGRTIGVVDEVVATRDGSIVGFVVVQGWFGRRRFMVTLEEVQSFDHSSRLVEVSSAEPAATENLEGRQ